ncbi:probable hexosyltransferase MUCI70 isoform X2 [Euphorbia lathyris]|uniref:probable hexosyltransferase MUCI70 isoform X2 n=1 Tax=Euphorbia lathyris TaxID=212925 RepID=UPI0033142207
MLLSSCGFQVCGFGDTMTGGSLGQRGSYGWSSQPSAAKLPVNARKSSAKILASNVREKERVLPVFCRYLRKVAMILLFGLAFLVFIWGSLTVGKESPTLDIKESSDPSPEVRSLRKISSRVPSPLPQSGAGSHTNDLSADIGFENNITRQPRRLVQPSQGGHGSSRHPCHKFTFAPPPPPGRRKLGPRPCPVCYIPAHQARASMPRHPSAPLVLRNLTYAVDENPLKTEPHGGSDFGGYPSLEQRSDSFNIKESMTVHCGFVKGNKPGHQTGFDIDEADRIELEQFHEVIVASAIFGNYDIIQEPKNISQAARKKVPFYMFIDKETEAYMKNSSVLDSNMKVGLWRIIVVHNIPYIDSRRNGKIPKLLLHRILPSVRYSIWIDGKLQLVVDPYQVLERFLWRQNSTFAISRHYRRFDVFEEAEANKAAGKYDNVSIDYQIEFYKKEGLTPYSRAKLPIISDVPEGCVIIREHVPITNLFTCLWFNEVDRFTSRDQLSFSTVRDKLMEKVDWNITMFLDCERRNFVIQAYHKDIMDHMPPPVARRLPPLQHVSSSGKIPVKKVYRRGKDRRAASRHRHKSALSNRDKQVNSLSCQRCRDSLAMQESVSMGMVNF